MNETAIAALSAGLVSAVSLPIGAALGLAARPGRRLTSALMAFGGGALLFALTIEIVAHTFHEVGFVPLAVGCILGGAFFELINQALNRRGAFLRKAATMVLHVTRLKRQRARSVLSRLARVEILHELPPEEVARIVPLVHSLQVRKGERVCTEGEAGDALYLVDRGELEASRGSEPLTRFRPGDTFGEMSLVTGAPRSATVTAATDVELFRVDKHDFDDLLRAAPEAGQQIRELVAKRSGDLADRKLLPEERAAAWKKRAASLVTDKDLAPTAREMAEAAKAHGGGAALGIWLGIFLDGIPESLVIGTMVEGFGHFGWPLIAGVFLANLPEAMSSSVVMRAQEYTRSKIFAMWTSITLITGLGALVGSLYLREMSAWSFAIIEGAAAGAMLTMIAETMLPEAYEQGGAIVGLSTLAGFLAALLVKSIA